MLKNELREKDDDKFGPEGYALKKQILKEVFSLIQSNA
jgi:hypothetical protein